MTFERAVDDEALDREHLLERVGCDVASVPGVEAVGADGRDVRARPFMQAHGQPELDHRREELVVVLMTNRSAANRVGPHHHPPHSVGRGATDFARGERRVVEGRDRHRNEAAGCGGTEVDDPTVVRARQRGRQVGQQVLGPREIEPEAREHRGNVDAFGVHRLERRGGVEVPAGQVAVAVEHLERLEVFPVEVRVLGLRTMGRHRPHRRLAADDHRAGVGDLDLLAECRIDVVVPHRERLLHMAIGVKDWSGAAHSPRLAMLHRPR